MHCISFADGYIIYHAIYMGGELRDEVAGTTDTCQWFSLEEIQSLTLVDLAALGVKLVFG